MRSPLIKIDLKTASSLLLGLGTIIAPAHGRADDSDFYRNKTITHVVMTSPGGSYDIYSRLFTQNIAKHIPGNPTVIVKYMPGAGGLTGTNYLYNAAPRDGTNVGMVINDLAVTQALTPAAVKFDARKFNWIGRLNVIVQSVIVSERSGITSVEDLKKREVAFGGFGKSANDYKIAMLLNALIGTRVKMVLGYKGSATINLAMASGEVDGRIGAWLSIAAGGASRIKDERLRVLAQSGLKRLPELPDVPLLLELIGKPEDKRMMELVDAGTAIGWSIVMPPGVPASRVSLLRKAFQAMIADSELREAAKKLNAPLDTATGEELAKLIDRTVGTPKDLVKRTAAIVSR